VGFLQTGDTTLAFIVQGSEAHTLEVGATLGGRFRVQAVTEDAVTLSSLAGDKQVRLPLVAETGPAASPKR
jgi:Tfp pilus assembly protein PilP